MIKRIYSFIRNNKDKKLTVMVWLWAAIFRMAILFIPPKNMKKHYGCEGEESPMTAEDSEYRAAKKIAYRVNRVASQTPWESKCLVRALTAQHMLTRKNIESTMYLGVGLKEGKMVAHAWIRTGDYYLTGGFGEGYSVVAKFRK